MAWLAVLELDPDDVAAAEAAERVLMATGEWQRCADLLSWAAARAESGAGAGAAGGPAVVAAGRAAPQPPQAGRRGAAPLSRARRAGGAAHRRLVRRAQQAAGPARRCTPRASRCAPGPAEKAKAHIDRGLVLLTEAARINEVRGRFHSGAGSGSAQRRHHDRVRAAVRAHAALGRARPPPGAESVDAAAAGRVAPAGTASGRVSERLEDLPTARAGVRAFGVAGSQPGRAGDRAAPTGQPARRLDRGGAPAGSRAGAGRAGRERSDAARRAGVDRRRASGQQRSRAGAARARARRGVVGPGGAGSAVPLRDGVGGSGEAQVGAGGAGAGAAAGRAAPRCPTPPTAISASPPTPRRRAASTRRWSISRDPIRATPTIARRWSGCRSCASRRGSGTMPGARPRRCSIAIGRR